MTTRFPSRLTPGIATGALLVLATASPVRSQLVSTERLTLRPGEFNLIGLTMHEAVVREGTFELVSGPTLIDDDFDFGAILDPDRTYVIEFGEDGLDGLVLEITAEDADGENITVDRELGTHFDVPYKIRTLVKLSEALPPDDPANPIALQTTTNFNPDEADLVLLPAGEGRFNQYYYSAFPGLEGFFNAVTGVPEDPDLPYTEAFFVLRRGATEIQYFRGGHIKTTATTVPVADTFNYLGTVYPARFDPDPPNDQTDPTLSNLGLGDSVLAGTAETADLIWMPDGAGGFDQFFLSDGTPPLTAGWRLAGGDDTDQGARAVTSGLILQRRAPAPYETTLTPYFSP